MISRLMEDAIRRIVRDEIAQDEMRRIEQERRAPSAVVPSNPPPLGTILLDFNPDRLEALDQERAA